MQIAYNVQNTEYNYVKPMVERFLLDQLPGISISDREGEVDKITEIFMGTRHTRLAGLPNPESQVQIRSVIREAINQHRPIPVLVGSGPKKNTSGQIDLAELSALRTLACIQKTAREYYRPGFNFRIRLEDATGLFLEGTDAADDMRKYCNDFFSLCAFVNAQVGDSNFLVPYLESESHEKCDEFLALAHANTASFELAWRTGNDEQLIDLGWVGGLTESWKEFLLDRYTRIYPGFSHDEHVNMAARYLSATLARHKLGMRAGSNSALWSIDGRHLELVFAPPVPGTSNINTRVYYRTMSCKQTKLHVPFWRAKGFFRLVNGELKMGLARGTDTENVYVRGSLELKHEGKSLRVAADVLEN